MALLLLATCVAAAPARAADPGRWHVTGTTTLPLLYYQGVTVDPARNFYFDGIFVGLYRTNPSFTETGRTADVIPPDVHAREGYNHIGDISWDRAEGGRVLLPLECYVPERAERRQPVPARLDRRRRPRHAAVALLREARPGRDPEGDVERGLARRHAGVDLESAATCSPTARRTSRSPTPRPAHAPIHSVRRLKGAVPPTGITGATFVDGRMLVAGQDGDAFRVYSIDLATGGAPARDRAHDRGRVGGARDRGAKGGTLGWLIQPFNPEGKPPTYSPDHATLVSFAPTGRRGAGPAAAAGRRRRRRAVARAPLLPPQAPDGAAARLPAGVLCPEGCTARADA